MGTLALEQVKSMKRKVNPVITLLLITLLFGFVFLLQVSAACLGMNGKIDETNANDSIYLQLQQESSPLKPEPDDYENMLEKLQDTELFKYYEIYGQPLWVEGKLFDEVSDHELPCVQIGENVAEDFGIETEAGRNFAGTDFVFDWKGSIPVILGHTYNGQIELGTRFQGEYLYDTYDFIVIGILKENSRIDLGFKSYLLDESAIMPSFAIADVTGFTDGMKIHYANKTSGVIRTSSGAWKDVERCIKEIVNHSPSGNYSWYSNSVRINFRQMFGIDVISLMILCIAGILLITVFYLFMICRKMRSGELTWKTNRRNILWQVVIYIVLSAAQLPVLKGTIYFIGFRLPYFVTPLTVLAILFAIDIIAYFWAGRMKSGHVLHL